MGQSDTLLIGGHVSVAGGVDNAPQRELDVGGNCGQIFTHSPQVWESPNLDQDEIDRFRAESEQLRGPWIIHTSYLVNLCTPKDDLRNTSIESVQEELDAAAALDVAFVNVHLGAHTGAGVETGLENATAAVDALDVPQGVRLLLESDAGAGTKLGGQFEHLARVRDRTDHQVDVCVDTAHSWAAGYDFSDADAVEETVRRFDDVVGLDALRCIHLNDSRHGRGSHKDEHAHIGEGAIGEFGMAAIVNHPDLRDRPFVLETPREPARDKDFPYDIRVVRGLRDSTDAA